MSHFSFMFPSSLTFNFAWIFGLLWKKFAYFWRLCKVQKCFEDYSYTLATFIFYIFFFKSSEVLNWCAVYWYTPFDKEEQQSTVLFTLLLIVSLLVTTVTGGVCKLFVDDPITIPTLDYQAMMLMIKTLFMLDLSLY